MTVGVEQLARATYMAQIRARFEQMDAARRDPRLLHKIFHRWETLPPDVRHYFLRDAERVLAELERDFVPPFDPRPPKRHSSLRPAYTGRGAFRPGPDSGWHAVGEADADD